MPLLELTPQAHGAEWGDSKLSQEGSGLAFPTGLETVFEYNGMVFNKLDQVDKIRVQKIDGLFDADIRDNRENNPSSKTARRRSILSMAGARSSSPAGSRRTGMEKLRDMQQAFRQAFADVNSGVPVGLSHLRLHL